MLLNVTDLPAYIFCPRKLYMRKILNIIEPPTKATVLGTLRHATHEQLSKMDETVIRQLNKDHSEDEAATLFSKNYLRALRDTVNSHRSHLNEVGLEAEDVFIDVWPFIKEEAVVHAKDVLSVSKATGLFGDDLLKHLPKVISEHHVKSESLQLKGIIDRIEVVKGQYIPYELKTGSAPADGVWPGHKIQVACYMMMLEEAFKMPVREGYVKYLDCREDRRVVMNPFLEIEVKELIAKVQKLLENKEMPDPCGKKFCNCSNVKNHDLQKNGSLLQTSKLSGF
ncbi:MAG: PD-(D/E)XK nuclease family protein [Candidatus Woesearchaeota archaeon]